ncbi:MAG: aldo/keto reductase [Bacteroidia bacterium]|nr:aldo/keto reductase [Bacteroidia bacterium]
MNKIPLGKSNLSIAPLIFGGNVFGWTVNEKTSFELLDEFVANGFNCIDTADIYSFWVDGNKGGESETIIGNWFKRSGKRKEIVIATKVGYAMPGQKNCLARSYILKSVDESLKRLQTDYIDLYQSHVDDAETPMEGTLSTYNELIKAGKVLEIGCSNFSAKRMAEAKLIAEKNNLKNYSTLQTGYNLYDREKYEGDQQQYCVENNISVIPYFSLASGFLTGKYRSKEDAKGKARGGRVETYFTEKGFKILNALDVVAKEYNCNPAEIALAWLSAQPGIVAPIASATNLTQLKSLMKSVSIKLSPTAIEMLNVASN